MTALTQAERERRRTADAGSRDETVYFAGSNTGTYHADRSCGRLTNSATPPRSLTRGEMLDRTRRTPCLYCTVPDLRKRTGGNPHPQDRYAELIEAEQQSSAGDG